MPKKILIVAGEASGDLHGANLVKNIKRLAPDTEISGLGGVFMEAAGAKLYFNLADMAVLGIGEVLLKYFKFKRIFNFMVEKVKTIRPDAVILIDYPGFNLRFAEKIKGISNIPVIYYISPQVWAWGAGRIRLIKKIVDKLIVIFKFEKNLYKEYGIDADFVGHPLLDVVTPSMETEEAKRYFAVSPGKKTIGLLPGSREPEIKKILPIMLKACRILDKNHDMQFILIKAPTIKRDLLNQIVKDVKLDMKIVEEFSYDAIALCDLAFVASGTATLETAMLGVPMIIIYKASFLTYILTRLIIRIPYIGLVNVVAGKKLIPEFLQYNTRPQDIARQAQYMLGDAAYMQRLHGELLKIKESLGEAGASFRAAKSVLDFLYANN